MVSYKNVVSYKPYVKQTSQNRHFCEEDFTGFPLRLVLKSLHGNVRLFQAVKPVSPLKSEQPFPLSHVRIYTNKKTASPSMNGVSGQRGQIKGERQYEKEHPSFDFAEF